MVKTEVNLLVIGSEDRQVSDVLQQVLGVEEREANRLLKAAPVRVMLTEDQAEADSFASHLRRVGAIAEVRPERVEDDNKELLGPDPEIHTTMLTLEQRPRLREDDMGDLPNAMRNLFTSS